MTQAPPTNIPLQSKTDALASSRSNASGRHLWYLYGITDRDGTEESEYGGEPGLGGGSVRVVPFGDLAAVVSPVPLIGFDPASVTARLQDSAWLEAMVRGHERVVEAVHRERTVVPAKFGCVYASVADLLAALERAQDTLLRQLRRLAGCDEWGVRLYAHRQTIEDGVRRTNSLVRQLQDQLLAAPPGRAYFLRRKLADTLSAATDQARCDLAQAAFDRAMGFAVAGELNSGSPMSRALDGETEILRAAFLVRRGDADAFAEDLYYFTAGTEGLRCEYSGPWPPYSFTGAVEESNP